MTAIQLALVGALAHTNFHRRRRRRSHLAARVNPRKHKGMQQRLVTHPCFPMYCTRWRSFKQRNVPYCSVMAASNLALKYLPDVTDIRSIGRALLPSAITLRAGEAAIMTSALVMIGLRIFAWPRHRATITR